MSDPDAKKERSLAKDKRQQPAPDKAVGSHKKAKKDKPVKVWAKWTKPMWMSEREPFVWGRYQTVEVAKEVVKKQKLKTKGDFLRMSLDRSDLE